MFMDNSAHLFRGMILAVAMGVLLLPGPNTYAQNYQLSGQTIIPSDGKLSSLSIEDRQAILDLISQYSFSFDSKDLASFLRLFTPDCVWEEYVDNGTVLKAHIVGRKELAVKIKGMILGLTEKGIQTRHYQTNTLLTPISKNEVHATTMLNLMFQYPDSDHPISVDSGVYHDTIVKTHGVWKFGKRTLLVDHK